MIKTFTKQNFKTYPLWIRLLIMTFMLLLGTSSAWGYNQSNVDLFFDNSTSKWTNCYVYIGKGDYTSCYALTRVSGTQYLWKLAAGFNSGKTWDGATGWVVSKEKWWDGNREDVYKFVYHGNNNVTDIRTTAWNNSTIYKANATKNVNHYSTNCTVYDFSTSTKSNYTVTIKSATGGTLTVKDYDNTTVSNGASKIKLTVLKFTATASTGYTFKEVKINNGSTTTTISAADLASKTYTLTSNVTITPVWTANQYTITYKDQGNVDFSGTHADDYPITHTYGTATTLKTATKTGYTFKGWFTNSTCTGNAVTSLGETTYTANITLYAKWEQSCTTPTAYQVSGSVPETVYTQYDGSIVIKLANSQTDVSYNLFKDEVKVTGKTKTGITGTALTWDGIKEGGVYTVKAVGCSNEDVAMTGSFKYECISDINLDFTLQDDATYCFGESEEVKINYKGTELTTKYGYAWTGSKYTYSSIIPKKEEKLPIYFNSQSNGTGDGYIQLNIKSCGATVHSNMLDFSVVQTPTITASKTSCAPYEVITLTSAAGANTTWEATPTGGIFSARTGESVTFKAAPGTYDITSRANGCTDTETITVECAEEDCSETTTTSNNIEIWLSSTLNKTMYLHRWKENGNSDTNITSWPGASTSKDNGYYKWTFTESGNIGYIFHDNTSSNKSSDASKTLETGYRYYFTFNGGTGAATFNKSEKITTTIPPTIVDPTVTTVSAEQKEGEPTVVIKGFLQATGCADITQYGYQYRVQRSGDFTDVLVNGSKNKCEEWTAELTDLEFGVTYEFRAMATNSSKEGTGDVIEVTVEGQSTPVVIKSIRNDRTVNESHWADFVALYVQEDGITAAGAKEVKNYTWEYSTDGENWVTNFTGYVLGGASATVGVTNGNAKCNNIRPTKTGKYRVKVTYDNAEELYSNIITIKNDGFKLKYPKYGQNAGSDFTFEAANRTIPVFVVKTTENFPDCPASGMPSQDVEGQKAKKSVDVKIFENGNVVYDRKARMNYRGSSSLNFRKKSYAFCTGKEKTKNSIGDVDTGKENLFGLSNGAKDKDWVLYAAMPDPSMMRNRLIFDTYAQMTGKWGVDSKFVELIIDDEYMGVYVLMDKITNNEDRVNITAADGFILKFDKTDVTDRFEDENSEKRNTFTTEKTGNSGIGSYGATFDQRFEIEYPEMEDMGTEKWVEFVNDNVKGKIEAFENALEAGNYTEVRKLIDYESWADWFIISEFAKNVDAYRASCYFVYNGDKIEARPLWDQELSFDNTATTVGNGKGCNSPDGLLIQNSGVYSDDFPAPFWFTGGGTSITGGLLNDPCFVTMVKNRYKDHLNNALSNGQLTSKIGEYQTELTDAAKARETAAWRPDDGEITACTGGGTGYNNIPISTSISTLNTWIAERPAGLTTALETLTGSSINISIEPSFVETYPWEPFTLTVDAPEGYEYDMTFTKEGADATGNMVVVKGGDIYTVKIKRPANTLNQLFETVPYLATATLKVADDGCGGMTTPEANVNIRLNDRVEDECPQPSLGQ